MPPVTTAGTEDLLTALSRSAAGHNRPSIVVLAEDLPAAERAVGSRTRAHKLLQDLEDAGRLRRVRRGVYAIASVTGVIDVDLLGLIDVVTPDPYLVTAGRALAMAELSDQHFRMVVVAAPEKLTNWSWRGEQTRYVRLPPRRLWGGRRTRARGNARVTVATPSRAVLDSTAHPEWGVTLAQVTQALDLAIAHDGRFVVNLATDAARYGSAAVARRLGFLVSRLYDDQVAVPLLALRGAMKGPVPLASAGPQDGPIDRTWGVRENVAFQRLIDHRGDA